MRNPQVKSTEPLSVKALKPPVYFSCADKNPNLASLFLHLKPYAPPVSSLSFHARPTTSENEILLVGTKISTHAQHSRKGYAGELLKSLERVLERMAYDYRKPVRHKGNANELSKWLVEKHGYKVEGYQLDNYGCERVFHPVKHELTAEEQKLLNWFSQKLRNSG